MEDNQKGIPVIVVFFFFMLFVCTLWADMQVFSLKKEIGVKENEAAQYTAMIKFVVDQGKGIGEVDSVYFSSAESAKLAIDGASERFLVTETKDGTFYVVFPDSKTMAVHHAEEIIVPR